MYVRMYVCMYVWGGFTGSILGCNAVVEHVSTGAEALHLGVVECMEISADELGIARRLRLGELRLNTIQLIKR